jgi:hypothetical protein
MERNKETPMEKFRFIVAAASALVVGALATGPARAAIQDGADALRAAADNGALVEQVQFRWGGYDYCWYDDGWRGPGWYWCGYAYRTGFGWGGPLGWNGWRRVVRDRDDFRFRDRDDFRGRREFGERREFREHEFREHDRDRR